MLDTRGHGSSLAFTIHFCPGDWGVHLHSFAKKVNALVIPRGEGLGVSIDWHITTVYHMQLTTLLVMFIDNGVRYFINKTTLAVCGTDAV